MTKTVEFASLNSHSVELIFQMNKVLRRDDTLQCLGSKEQDVVSQMSSVACWWNSDRGGCDYVLNHLNLCE